MKTCIITSYPRNSVLHQQNAVNSEDIIIKKHIINNMKTVILRFPPPYCWGRRYCDLFCHVVG